MKPTKPEPITTTTPEDEFHTGFAIEAFLGRLESRGYSPATVRLRRWILGEFGAYAARGGVTDIRAVTTDFLRTYITHLSKNPTVHWKRERYSKSALESVAVTLRVFFRELAGRGLLMHDPARGLEKIRVKQTPPAAMTPLQAERVLSQPDTESADGLRDRAILELLYGTGIRRGEAAALRVSDVRVESGTVFVRQGKGRRDRVIPLGERAGRWIRRYLEESRPLLSAGAKRDDDGGRDSLFLLQEGRKISPARLTKIASKYMRMAGMEKGSCHLFRHTCATEMLEGGADISHIQELLGHERTATSELYLHLSPARLRERYARSHPSVFAHPEEASLPEKRSRTHHRIQKRRVPGTARAAFVRRREYAAGGEIIRGVNEYLESRRLELAEATLHSFRRYLQYFAEWCFLEGVGGITHITVSVLEGYQKALSRRKKKSGDVISIKSQRYEMEAVCTFVRWCHDRGYMLSDPSVRIELPRVGKSLTAEYLTREEVERVLSFPDTRYPHGLRDRAILELAYASGMRASELCALSVADLDFERDSVRVIARKQGRDRVIPVSGRAMQRVYRYAHEVRDQFVREDCGREDSEILFLADTGRALSVSALQGICRKHLRAAGITRGSVHVFRHSCATHMIENGADLRTVQEFLGHRTIESTKVYAHISIRTLKEVHARTHPAERRMLECLRRSELESEEVSAEERRENAKEEGA